ncbi:MAG: rod shape-determining protein MreC [Acidobacteriota bacterium]
MTMTLARRRELTLLLVLQIAHLIVISGQIPAHGRTTLLETAIFRALSPFQRAAAVGASWISRTYRGYVWLREASAENARLRREIETARLELTRSRADKGELDRLRQILRLAESWPYQVEPALVIGSDSLNPMKTMFINKGSSSGVRQNSPVVSPEGFLVGRIITPVAPSVATVQLITDGEASVGVILATSRTYAVLGGMGDGRCSLRYVPNIVEVAADEEVLTSGLDQIYPRGVFIGRVTSSGPTSSVFKEVTVAPAVQLNRLEHVLVIIGDKPQLTRPSTPGETEP